MRLWDNKQSFATWQIAWFFFDLVQLHHSHWPYTYIGQALFTLLTYSFFPFWFLFVWFLFVQHRILTATWFESWHSASHIPKVVSCIWVLLPLFKFLDLQCLGGLVRFPFKVLPHLPAIRASVFQVMLWNRFCRWFQGCDIHCPVSSSTPFLFWRVSPLHLWLDHSLVCKTSPFAML